MIEAYNELVLASAVDVTTGKLAAEDYPDVLIPFLADEFDQINESLVFHTFTIAVISLEDESVRYEWRGVERYEFADDGRISLIDVFYKDTTGLMAFIGA